MILKLQCKQINGVAFSSDAEMLSEIGTIVKFKQPIDKSLEVISADLEDDECLWSFPKLIRCKHFIFGECWVADTDYKDPEYKLLTISPK